MKVISVLLGISALLAVLVAFLPLLGWLNWVVIPYAVFCLIVSAVFKSSGGKVMSIVAIFLGILRLMFGGGIL